ncbi:hypothetical protein NGR_b08130 (plasmid) [Sinorhizobium fredii NGR234]|uniref:Uncharacterized protein n=1 Tax=Sinorhizobium fredii (strain NBRC 101917 / NGR234) TaxID=394 RepID=C3KQB1_SINFN|nr:hypothetical protein NGR_b08130 [Sinorhizobium fredii NGR234]
MRASSVQLGLGRTVTAGARLSGEGVTLFFTNGAATKLLGNGDIDLTAATSGPYAGLLFFGSRHDTGVTHQVTGNSESRLEGNLYMPTAASTLPETQTYPEGAHKS